MNNRNQRIWHWDCGHEAGTGMPMRAKLVELTNDGSEYLGTFLLWGGQHVVCDPQHLTSWICSKEEIERYLLLCHLRSCYKGQTFDRACLFAWQSCRYTMYKIIAGGRKRARPPRRSNLPQTSPNTHDDPPPHWGLQVTMASPDVAMLAHLNISVCCT